MSTLSPPTRTLNVEFDNWKWRKATIYDASDASKTPLYRIEFHMRNPQIRFEALSSSASASASLSSSASEKEGEGSFQGTATFPCLSSRINIDMHGHTMTLSPRKFLSDAYTYTSPSRGNATMTWESPTKWTTFKIVCLDESKMPVARVDLGCGSRTKGGTIELVGKEVVADGREQEELVLSGLAVMQQRLTNYVAAVSH